MYRLNSSALDNILREKTSMAFISMRLALYNTFRSLFGSSKAPMKPLIAVLGATGTGKSKVCTATPKDTHETTRKRPFPRD